MTLSEIKNSLSTMDQVRFVLPNGERIPEHFHVTEVGTIEKHFIDCGGTVRNENVVNFQLWYSDDHDHRLSAVKLRSIIELSERTLGLEDHEIEVEYQSDTIGKYGLRFNGEAFELTEKQTDCLARDKCGVPEEKPRVSLASLDANNNCEPGSGCC